MAKINLDALIQREDFQVTDQTNSGTKKSTISVVDLEQDSFFFSTIRKPDFQRETNEWDGPKIMEFLESFLDGDLIPAIILWKSPSGYIFVIDGSHRISALRAWMDDDYGDGKISKSFYDGVLPEDQVASADSVRKKIEKNIGSYSDFKLALTHPNKVDKTILERAKNLSSLAIQLQWVEGDANKAEVSFFKINRQASPINKTELILLESRKKPNCIAARAIIRSGKGHKYWSDFSPENQQRVEELAKEINTILFAPPLHTPIKTQDIPIAGKAYSVQTLPLVLDFINIVNEIPNDFKDNLPDDNDGSETIKFLEKARKIAWRINSMHASSLGLHPLLYFYSSDGRHKIASFFATLAFVMEMEKKNNFNDFISVRSKFEEFLPKFDYLIQQIFRKYRSASASFLFIKDFYFEIIEELKANKNPSDAVDSVLKTKKYSYLTLLPESNIITSSEFSKDRKSAVYIKDTFSNIPKCKICNGYIHTNSITIDHKSRKQDGGVGSIENGQISHPYCNTTYKN
ncbi:MAG: HNH endonuclease signature motif containing protein [Candidatus Paceibacterota bacterium]